MKFRRKWRWWFDQRTNILHSTMGLNWCDTDRKHKPNFWVVLVSVRRISVRVQLTSFCFSALTSKDTNRKTPQSKLERKKQADVVACIETSFIDCCWQKFNCITLKSTKHPSYSPGNDNFLPCHYCNKWPLPMSSRCYLLQLCMQDNANSLYHHWYCSHLHCNHCYIKSGKTNKTFLSIQNQ
jgi:hypothetical protein